MRSSDTTISHLLWIVNKDEVGCIKKKISQFFCNSNDQVCTLKYFLMSKNATSCVYFWYCIVYITSSTVPFFLILWARFTEHAKPTFLNKKYILSLRILQNSSKLIHSTKLWSENMFLLTTDAFKNISLWLSSWNIHWVYLFFDYCTLMLQLYLHKFRETLHFIFLKRLNSWIISSNWRINMDYFENFHFEIFSLPSLEATSILF